MKRIIALLLALCMCYAAPVMADNSVSLYEEENEAYKFLNALGIVESISENQLIYLKNPAKRGDFVKYAMLLGGYNAADMNYTHSVYNDVSISDENFKYINCAYELGFVSGKGDFMFGPDDSISYNEAIKIITCVLGADKIAKALGGYPAGYTLTASKLGIKLDNVTNSSQLTNGDVIRLLHSALFSHTAFDNGEDVTIDYSDFGITLEKHHNVKILSGVIKSAGGIALTLDKGSNTEADEIMVGNSKFKFSDNPQRLLGMYADVYYRKDKNFDYALYVDISDNNVTVIDSDDFVSVKNSKIEYTEIDVNFETKYKQKTINISGSCDVVYNGRPYPFYDDKMLDLTNYNGSITCISSGKKSSADVVIVEAYSNYVVASVDKMNKVIYSKLPHETLDFSEISDVEVFDAYENKRTFDDIFAADVVSVTKSADGKYAKIITSSRRENRKVIEKLSNNKVVFDNKEIAVFDSIVREKAENELLLGRLLDVSYDYKGRICDFIYTDYEDGIDYGYLIKIGGNTSGLSSTVKVKLLRLTSVFEEYFVAEKLKLDGDMVSNKEFYEKFVLTDDSNGKQYTDMQMIKFAVDENTGEINYIDSKYLGENEKGESLTSITHASASFIMDIGSLEGLNAFEKGYFLNIPKPDSSLPPSAVNDIPQWRYYATNSIINAGDMGGTFEVVDADEAGWASILIHRPIWLPVGESADSLEGVAKGEDTIAIVDSFTYTIDNYENEVVKLTYYDNTGAKKTNFLRHKNLIKKPVKASDGTITYKDMEQGDLFAYDTDTEGYIYTMSLCFNISDITNEKFFRTALDGLGGKVCGVAYGASDKGLSLLCTVKEGDIPDFSSGAPYDEIFDVDSRYTRTLAKNFSKVVVCDVENETIRKGTIDDIVTCKTDVNCPSIVYARMSLGRIAYIFIINNYR